MKFTVTLNGSNMKNGFSIEPGESVEIPLSFYNADGTSRSMVGAVLTAKVFREDGTEVAGIASISGTTLIITAANTASLIGAYAVRIIETRSGDTPPTTSYGSFRLLVRPSSFQ